MTLTMKHIKNILLIVMLLLIQACSHGLDRYVEPTSNDAASITFEEGRGYYVQIHDEFDCLQDQPVVNKNNVDSSPWTIKISPNKPFDLSYKSSVNANGQMMSCYISVSFMPEPMKEYFAFDSQKTWEKEEIGVLDYIRGTKNEGVCSVRIFEKNGGKLYPVEIRKNEEKRAGSLSYGITIGRSRREHCWKRI